MKPTTEQILEARVKPIPHKDAKCGVVSKEVYDALAKQYGNATFGTSEALKVQKWCKNVIKFTYLIGHVETWECEECGGTGEYKREYIGDTSRGWNVPCRDCHGKGTLSAEVVEVRVEEEECPDCRGKKYFCEDYGSEFDCDEENVRCEDCGFSDTCSDCNGSGKVTRIIYVWREK